MKNEQTPENHRVRDIRARSESFDFTKRLSRALRDLEHNQCWKYGQLPPVQLLEKLELDERPTTRMNSHAPNAFGIAGRACFL